MKQFQFVARKVVHPQHLLSSMIIASLVMSTAAPQAAEAKSKKPKSKPHCKTTVQPDNEDSAEAENRWSGNISWYGVPFHGRKTASGRIFDMNKLTCAHRTLPFGTKILVENPRNGNSVIVEVIDRGPFVRTRVMDVSREAARQLGTLTGGVAYVNCLVVRDKADGAGPVSAAPAGED